jgi:DNA-binding MarR family transcriptional regulator
MALLKNETLREVGAIARAIQSVNDIRFKKLDLQRGQFIFLTRIHEYPGINMIELTNMLRVDKATTTKAIQKLLEEGYVLRERDDADKRMWHLYPSEKAREIYPLLIEEENRNLDVCFMDFAPDEKETAYSLLKRMRDNIDKDWRERKVKE